MRTQSFRLFAIVSMLALLFGAQLCMVVQCAPGKATSDAHACCAKGVAKSPAPEAPSPHESAKPCCIQVTTAAAPELQPPAALDLHSLAALLVAGQLAAAAPAALEASPPGDAPAPHPAPPLSAAGSRAPPLA
jgi:hypothetical protein